MRVVTGGTGRINVQGAGRLIEKTQEPSETERTKKKEKKDNINRKGGETASPAKRERRCPPAQRRGEGEKKQKSGVQAGEKRKNSKPKVRG